MDLWAHLLHGARSYLSEGNGDCDGKSRRTSDIGIMFQEDPIALKNDVRLGVQRLGPIGGLIGDGVAQFPAI